VLRSVETVEWVLMVVRATANGAAYNEHRRENLYGGNPRSTYFKQLEADTAISEGVISS
jgi:hypothetical protein